MDKLREQITQEIGYVSGIFMSQGDTKAGDIVMPTEKLEVVVNNILSHFTSLLTEIEGKIEKEKCEVPPEPKKLDPRKLEDIDKLLKYAGRINYNQALTDILSIINNYKK